MVHALPFRQVVHGRENRLQDVDLTDVFRGKRENRQLACDVVNENISIREKNLAIVRQLSTPGFRQLAHFFTGDIENLGCATQRNDTLFERDPDETRKAILHKVGF